MARCSAARSSPGSQIPGRHRGAETLRELLEQHLDVVRRAAEANVNADEVRRLFARAPDRIRALVATEGYFSPSIDATIDDHASPWKLAFVVDPGTRAVVRNVDLRFQGAVLVASPHNEERIARLKAEWKLQPGEPFRSEVWEAAKRDTLRDLLIVLYPTARIVDSRATVNPETATVDLFAEFDSGPAVTVGQLEVTGLTRYQRSIVDGMNTIAPGSAYSQVQLLRFQQRLQNSGYFSSVSVRVDPDAAQPGDTPIIVDVVERKTQRVAFGLGYSTNYGAACAGRLSACEPVRPCVALQRAYHRRPHGAIPLRQPLLRASGRRVSKWRRRDHPERGHSEPVHPGLCSRREAAALPGTAGEPHGRPVPVGKRGCRSIR